MMLGSKLLDTILMGVSTLTAILMAGVFAYSEYFYVKPPLDASKDRLALVEDHKSELIPKSLKLEKVIVNIKSHRVTRLRYLETDLDLVPIRPKYLELFEKKRSEILDAIIGVTGKMTADELNSISGKILLENRIKKQVNEIVGGSSVKEIYFSKFVIQ